MKISEDARAELSASLPTIADDAIDSHFRTRAEPPFLFSTEEVDSSLPILRSDYPEYVAAVLERAEHASDRRFILAGNNPAGSFLDCGRPTDWHASPNGDREGLFTLNRHRWFFDLARAWRLSGTERFASAWVEQIVEWIERCPAPRDGRRHFHDFSPWKVLNAAIRVADFWVPSYHLLRSSAALDVDSHLLFLWSIREHARILSEHIFDSTHNHTVKEMGGLLSIALYFPEFAEAQRWREVALETLERCMNQQMLDDGVHFEATPAYHKITMDWFLLPYVHAVRSSATFSPSFEQSIRKMAQFAYASSFPDGSTVPIGDSDRDALEKWSSDREYLTRLVHTVMPDAPVPACPGGDPDVFWITGRLHSADDPEPGGASGQAEPADRAVPNAYPSGGFFIMADGWDEKHGESASPYLIIRNGPMNHGHPHADLLSFLLYYDGKIWLTDTGKYTYNETPRRKYLKGTRSHNTVAVDWEDQAPYRDRMSFGSKPEWKNSVWSEHEAFVFYEGSHTGYSRLPKPVVHTRQIVWVRGAGWLIVDRFTGEGDHLFDQFFHFPTLEGVTLECEPGGESDLTGCPHVTFSQGAVTLHIRTLAPTGGIASLKQAWVSPAYGQRHDTAVYRYRLEQTVPATIVTWLGFDDEPKVLLESATDSRVSVLIDSARGRRLVVGPGAAILESQSR